MGSPLEGVGYVGYDTILSKYVSTWMDNSGTGIQQSEGVADPTGKSVTYSMQTTDPVKGRRVTWRVVVTLVSTERHVVEMYSPRATSMSEWFRGDSRDFKEAEFDFIRVESPEHAPGGIRGSVNVAMRKAVEQRMTLEKSAIDRLRAARRGGNFKAVLGQLASELRSHPLVAEVEQEDEGLILTYLDGTLGMVVAPSDGSFGAAAASLNAASAAGSTDPLQIQAVTAVPPQDSPSAARLPRTLGIGSTRVLLLESAFNLGGERLPSGIDAAAELLETSVWCFSVDRVKDASKGRGSVDSFKGWDRYGLILVTTHGMYRKKTSQVLIDSNVAVTTESVFRFAPELKAQRMVSAGETYWLTPKFFETHTAEMPRTLVYFNACESARSDSLAKVFLGKGAAAFLGYTRINSVGNSLSRTPDFVRGLLGPDATVSKAYAPLGSEVDPYPVCYDPEVLPSCVYHSARLVLHASLDVSVQVTQKLADGKCDRSAEGQRTLTSPLLTPVASQAPPIVVSSPH
jgi:hypothetical protein